MREACAHVTPRRTQTHLDGRFPLPDFEHLLDDVPQPVRHPRRRDLRAVPVPIVVPVALVVAVVAPAPATVTTTTTSDESAVALRTLLHVPFLVRSQRVRLWCCRRRRRREVHRCDFRRQPVGARRRRQRRRRAGLVRVRRAMQRVCRRCWLHPLLAVGRAPHLDQRCDASRISMPSSCHLAVLACCRNFHEFFFDYNDATM